MGDDTGVLLGIDVHVLSTVPPQSQTPVPGLVSNGQLGLGPGYWLQSNCGTRFVDSTVFLVVTEFVKQMFTLFSPVRLLVIKFVGDLLTVFLCFWLSFVLTIPRTSGSNPPSVCSFLLIPSLTLTLSVQTKIVWSVSYVQLISIFLLSISMLGESLQEE